MKFSLAILGILFGVLLFIGLGALYPVCMPLHILVAGNSISGFYLALYCVFMGGVMVETFIHCETFILEESVSRSYLFFKAIVLWGVIVGVGTLVGNWLYENRTNPSYSNMAHVYMMLGAMVSGVVILLVCPFIVRFCLVTPLEDREARIFARRSGRGRGSRGSRRD